MHSPDVAILSVVEKGVTGLDRQVLFSLSINNVMLYSAKTPLYSGDFKEKAFHGSSKLY